jgi:hypothetical protein
VRAIFLAVASDALTKFSAFFGGFDADAENLDFIGNVSLGFINEGRHLGPAPRSPTAAIEERDGCWRIREHSGKFHGLAVNVLKLGRGKRISDSYLGHFLSP